MAIRKGNNRMTSNNNLMEKSLMAHWITGKDSPQKARPKKILVSMAEAIKDAKRGHTTKYFASDY